MSDLNNESRRQFLKKTAYVVPVILTLKAMPAMAGQGSCRKGNNGVGNGPDYLPRGIQQNGKTFLDNDDHGGIPGAPQNQGGFNFNTFSSNNHHHHHHR
jgi:hypothetical protein